MADQTRVSRLIGLMGISLGLWLLLSPVILNYQSFDAIAQQTIIGLVIVLVAGVRVSLPLIRWPSWIAIILGIELVLLPLTLAPIAAVIQWNATITGLALLGIAGYSLSLRRSEHHADHASHVIPSFR